ncbi:hypothetical protein ABT364_04285 [Massilia sp. SR12]
MKQSTKSALLSGLILPGIGQLVIQKRRIRGLLFMLPALAAFLWLMYGLSLAMNKVMYDAATGKLPPDVNAISERLLSYATVPGADLALWTMFACWLASLIDALFIKDRN